MTYTEALDYIHSRRPNAPKPGLERIKTLLSLLGNPQKKLKYVHVAGTNGKGSTCAMTASILQAAGYKTGLYTSPFIHRFNERFRIDGLCIPDETLAEITEKVKAAADTMELHPAEFEVVTAIGFEYFARENVDIVVLEVGLGGRFDATNAIDKPECAVICNIGLDHTEFLGDTLPQIAMEKAGIIKPGCSVAMYPAQDEEVVSVIAAICRERGASLRIAEDDEIELRYDDLKGQEFCYCDDTPLRIKLLGDHQCRNAATALECIEVLRMNGWDIPDEAVKAGLLATRWPARFELIGKNPWFVADGGHNCQCAEAVRSNLEYYFPDEKRVLLLGMMADKDIDGFADILAPCADAFVCVRPNSPRAISAQALGEKLKKYKKPVFIAPDIPQGVAMAKGAAGKDGVVCATGSLYLMGDVREALGKKTV